MEEIIRYVGSNYPTIIRLTIEHLYLVSISVGAAILSGVPIGILITKDKKLADAVLYIASVIITIPSVALFLPRMDESRRSISVYSRIQKITFQHMQLRRPFVKRRWTLIQSLQNS